MRNFPMRPVKTTMRKPSGIALITTLLLLLLMSAMVVGFMLLVTEGQRLSGMNNEQSRAFYGAESGMEKLTADLGSLFATTYAPAARQVDDLATRRSEEHTSELQSRSDLVCRLLLEKKKKTTAK